MAQTKTHGTNGTDPVAAETLASTLGARYDRFVTPKHLLPNGGTRATGDAPASNGKARKPAKARGRKVTPLVGRLHTTPGTHPFDEVTWDRRTAVIKDETGATYYEQTGVEVPSGWSQTATNIVVSKYFHGDLQKGQREHSVRQLINRVTETITQWGVEGGYFVDREEAEAFYAELTWLCLHQYMAFNSPVWFNVGVEAKPQCSACFINSVEDTMESILTLCKTEGMLFKFGSGTGSNLSPIRSARERLGGGGTASGPVSFMKGFDAFAGVIKSGGKTRRAAKMVILNVDHPDIKDFITCKANEEKKAWALIDAGYDGSIDGEAYNSVFFQNANHSVRVTDDFMQAVEQNASWTTRAILDGRPMDTIPAKDLFRSMAEAAWFCGDPGMQFHTTINAWHTCPNTAPIHASNPCSEYMFLNDTACNLASLNLMKFRREDGRFDVEAYQHAVHVTITAMEIIVSNASYPTERIGINSENFRPLGIGYANLGALLMSNGLAYDSEEGRAFAAAVTAVMGGQAYKTSAQIAERVGPFNGYAENREPMLRVIAKHGAHVDRINPQFVPEDLLHAAGQVWDDAYAIGEVHGFRNSQATVLAPTGTIAFMMDCDTTGVEPDIALVKYKKLVGGGTIKIVNNTVPLALKNLGYHQDLIDAIVRYIEENDTIEGAPGLKPEHLPVFDCAFKPVTGLRSIHYMGHILMMGAVQPYLSGAISKTVNMPKEASVADIEEAYLAAWHEGLKAIAIYRDGSKRIQPLSTSLDKAATGTVVGKPRRRRLPDERVSITHKFDIQGHEGYLTVGMYEDGTPGELFITMSKEGSTISGLMDSLATATSIMLQYGVPLSVLVDKFTHMRFEPSGFTKNPQIPMAKSIVDYIFRWLALKFVDVDPTLRDTVAARTLPLASNMMETTPAQETTKGQRFLFENSADAPSCAECGAIMIRNGSCYKCLECGSTSGCS